MAEMKAPAPRRRFRRLRRWLHETFKTEETFRETEIQANRLGGVILLVSGIILGLILILTLVDIFPLSRDTIVPPTVQGMIECAILVIVCHVFRYNKWWLKCLLVVGLTVVYARLDSLLTHKAAILMVIPVVFSSRYFSRRLTIMTAVLSCLLFLGSGLWGATSGMINLNIVTMEPGVQMVSTGGFLGDTVKNAGLADPEAWATMLRRNTLLYEFLPKWLMFTVAAIISVNIAKRGRELVLSQRALAEQHTRISTELSLATRIQAHMLPNIFPPFPDRRDVDIFASMAPAKEVGGDFYDFFLLDEDHLALVMADVSGKGVPAALFMMVCKILVQNYAMTGLGPAETIAAVNRQICMNNPEDMFVTAWLGILDLRTGHLKAVNAGHEYPMVQGPDGRFEAFHDKHSFVIGGLSDVRYKDYEMDLEPGSRLFLYTDGLPEAVNPQMEAFGTERMLDALNEAADSDPQEILDHMRRAVEDFTAGAESFDDTTMLCVRYLPNRSGKEAEA